MRTRRTQAALPCGTLKLAEMALERCELHYEAIITRAVHGNSTWATQQAFRVPLLHVLADWLSA
jgi:hypothetical protein